MVPTTSEAGADTARPPDAAPLTFELIEPGKGYDRDEGTPVRATI